MNYEIKYCRACGVKTEYKLPEDGDNKKRYVCTSCKLIHYQNPLLVVGTIAYKDNKVLLCKRAIEPMRGYWTLPAGFMELGETLEEGAKRETHEEAGANIEIQKFFCNISVPLVGQVHVFYIAKMLNEKLNIGVETLEARLFSEEEIPWDNIAFNTGKIALKHFFKDLNAGQFNTYDLSINNK